MFERQRSGSVVCPSCGRLVGVNDEKCLNCGRPRPGMWGFAGALRNLGRDMGLLPLITGLCVLFYGVTLAVDFQGPSQTGLLSFLAPSGRSSYVFGMSGAVPVFADGRWWTVLSANWLHGGLLHIGFNMYALRQLLPLTVELYGAARSAILYILAGATGFLLTSVMGLVLPLPILGGAHYTLGASAAICGLLGALFHYGARGGSRGIREAARNWAIYILIFGFVVPGIDNWGHAGGFLGGYLVSRWLDPLKPERTDHVVGALALLALSLLAIVVSVITALPMLKGA